MDESQLRRVPLFAELSKGERKRVAQLADEGDIPAGKHLTREDAFAYEFFAIEDGTAEVHVGDRRVRDLGPGDFFGEMGEMHYQVWKWLDDGAVEFRIHAYSRPATSGPLWLRLGFRLVGRSRQLAFYRDSCRRMRRMVESELELADVRARAGRVAA